MRVPLPFNKVIYVMEDIDAASHVVQKRSSPDSSLANTLAALMQSQNPKPDTDSQDQQKHQTAVATTSTTTTAIKVAGEATGITAADGVVLTRATSVTHEQAEAHVLKVS